MVDCARQRIAQTFNTLVRRFRSYEEGFHLRLCLRGVLQSTVTCRLRMANNIVLATERYIHVHVAHFAVRKHRSLVTGAYKIHQSNEQRIKRLITLDLQITWEEQPIKFDLKWQAQTRLFTEIMSKKYVVITLQAQACYRKRPIKINLDFFPDLM